MFAVPGFSSLSTTSLKSASASTKNSNNKAPTLNTTSVGVAAKNDKDANNKTSRNRKRKRGDDNEEPVVKITSENLGDLWEKIIEGKSDDGSKKKNKSEAVQNGDRTGETTQNSNKHNVFQQKSSKGADELKKEVVPSSTKKEKKQKKGSEKVHLDAAASTQNDSMEGMETSQVVDQQDSVSKNTNKKKDKNKSKMNTTELPSTKEEEKTDIPASIQPDSIPAVSTNKDKSKSKSKKEKKLEKTTQTEKTANHVPKVVAQPPAASPITTAKLTPLQEKMRLKLSSARFRHLNQMLYTTPSVESLQHFKSQPEMFHDYHAGFRQQVEMWPENPVDIFIKRLSARGKLRADGYRSNKNKSNGPTSANSQELGERGENNNNDDVDMLGDTTMGAPLPRGKDGFTTVVDLGCGDAAIATHFRNMKPRPKIKILSYDLHAPNSLVTVADIANLPLPNFSADIAVFCLALMGTNWLVMIEEAVRVLRNGGEVWIAEIKSRFARTKGEAMDVDNEGGEGGGKKSKGGKNNKNNKEKSGKAINPADAFVEEKNEEAAENARWSEGEQRFISALSKRGLRLKQRDGSNKMFVLMEFEKTRSQGQWTPMSSRANLKFIDKEKVEEREDDILKPCVYKLR